MSSTRECWRGHPGPLGATLTPSGVNFALYSENAEKVFLCLFDEQGHETDRIEFLEQTHKIWHAFIPDLKAGQYYGYRLQGPFEPQKGQFFNVNKLLLDPYARAISGPVVSRPALFYYDVGNKEGSHSFNTVDSANCIPKSIVMDNSFDWGDDKLLKTPWNKTVIYELHVKGFTKTNPEVPENLRGTYLGLAHPKVIAYLKDLGITAVELMPIHQFFEEDFLLKKGLCNYWGYNTIGYFSPEWRYSSKDSHGHQVYEFKEMVKALHKAGLEVILDVVYNHTAEGNHLGPLLSFKGIDNASYYRLVPENPELYMDYTGCGNTLNVVNPHVLRLIIDSLRYWVTEMHVDGFRFDLASALAREFHEVNELHAFFTVLQQDPVLNSVKLIAEPWDLGEGGYQVGNFPDQWSEWNDKFRDTVRAFWKGEEGRIADLGYRLMGSSDLYDKSGRGPSASINFITAHDGFTLSDLVSYDHKHNEANLEDNKDGNDNNHSSNWGVEGPSQDLAINKLRLQIKKNFLVTLLLSQGIPMIAAGDEIGRTQKGNNNAYCQDNEISWLDWAHQDKDLLQFTRQLIHLRRDHPVFHRRSYFEGESLRPGGKKDIFWFLPTGLEMSEEDWSKSYAKCIAMEFTGTAIKEHDEKNHCIVDDNFIWMLNASAEAVEFQFPPHRQQSSWTLLIDTSSDKICENVKVDMTRKFTLQAHSTVLLRQIKSMQ